MIKHSTSELAVFRVAFSIESDELREEYLQQVCGEDQTLYDRVTKLLRTNKNDTGFLEPPAPGIAPTLDVAPIAEKPGMKIGRYKLVHEIGHGGMGVVYMAVQKEPVKRKVALKIIKPGMDTKEVVARFNAERQALAMMDHQCIATVLDGGSTESGRPYFVMELVEGTPIGEYCDACRYTTRQRLELFIQVCQAVQHAHLKGIIHRDIKPSNILVTTYDTVAVPKVIDFGIAKAVHQQLTDQSLHTNVSQMIGTPLYMSPEQAQRTGQDVDTRTDVYSLGVLLYELLTGTTPFDKERFQESGLDEVKRIIREEEPPRPSTRLSTLGETGVALDTLAERHHTDLRTLTQELSGELDWIVMRAMEKDRTRRYESASELAKDVLRYLDDDAVEACPPSKVYRLRKFARRQKLVLSVIATVAVVVVLASVVSTGFAAWAVQAERVARMERAEAMDAKALAEEAEQLAQRQKEVAKQQRDAAEYGQYASNMRLASYERTAGSTYSILRLLDSHLPESDRRDFRGWEWYYFFSQCHHDRITLPFHTELSQSWGPPVRQFGSAIGWSTDGESLATVDRIGVVDIWDVTSGERKATLKGRCGWVNSICWSPDGKHVAAGGGRRRVTVWDAMSGEKLRTLDGHSADVLCIDWNPDAVRLASGGADGAIHIWDSRTGEKRSSLVGPYGLVRSLGWHPDGRQLLASYGHLASNRHCELKIWDTATGDEIVGWKTGYGFRAAYSPDGGRVAWGTDRVRITDVNTRKVVSSFSQPGAHGGTWSPSGDRLATLTSARTIKIWGAEDGAEISSILGRGPAHWSPTGRYLAAASSSGGVHVWDSAVVGEAMTLAVPHRKVLSVAFSPDGQRVLAGARYGMLKVWDVRSGEESLAIQQSELSWIRCVAWCPDGTRFAARMGNDVAIYDATTGEQVLPSLECGGEAQSLAWSPDGKVLAIGLRNYQASLATGRVELWDTSSGKEVGASASAKGACNSIAWSPDGKRIAVRGSERVFVRNSTLREQYVIEHGCQSVGWSPDGQHLATGLWDGQVEIYDALDGTLLQTLWGHVGAVETVAWHPHTGRLASGSRDGTIRIWDTSTGQLLCVLDTHEGQINELDWSADGMRLASASNDCTVRIWDASPAYRFFKMHGNLREEVYKLVHEDEYQEAIKGLQRLRSLHPDETELETQIRRIKWLDATQLARDGRLDEAVAIYDELSAESADLPDYRLQLPAVLFEAGKQTESIQMLEEAVAEFPETAEYRDELAFLYEWQATDLCQSGAFEIAIPILLKLAKEFPQRPDFRAELACQMVKANHLEEMVATFGKITESCSHWPDYRPELARRLLGIREAAMAATIYEQLVDEFPNVPEYSEGLAAAKKLFQPTNTSQATSEEGKDGSPESKPDTD